MFIWGTGVRQMSPSKNISSQNDRFEWKETAQALYRSYVKHAYLCPGGIARVDWEFSHVNLLRQSGLSHRAPLQVAHHCGIGSLRACPAALCGHVVWTKRGCMWLASYHGVIPDLPWRDGIFQLFADLVQRNG